MTDADAQVRALVARRQLEAKHFGYVCTLLACPCCRVAALRNGLELEVQWRKPRGKRRWTRRAQPGKDPAARYLYLECVDCGYAGLHWYATVGSLPGWRPTVAVAYYEDCPCLEGRLSEGSWPSR